MAKREYIAGALRHQEKQAEGWRLLHALVSKANLNDDQLFCIHLALGFPVLNEMAETD
jgi:hypothetical protein